MTASRCFLRENETLRYAIEYKMKQKGLTIKELAHNTGVNQVQLHRYFHPEKYPHKRLSQAGVLKIADFLGIKVSLNVALL